MLRCAISQRAYPVRRALALGDERPEQAERSSWSGGEAGRLLSQYERGLAEAPELDEVVDGAHE